MLDLEVAAVMKVEGFLDGGIIARIACVVEGGDKECF